MKRQYSWGMIVHRHHVPAPIKSLTRRVSVLVVFLVGFSTTSLLAQPPCTPCAGISVSDPHSVAALLQEMAPFSDEARLYVRWFQAANETVTDGPADALAQVGATPWVGLQFSTPSPVLENIEHLNQEIGQALETARAFPDLLHYQIFWTPEAGNNSDLAEYSFLFKRVSVALRGASPEARVVPRPLPRVVSDLDSFYQFGDAAYLDGISFPAEGDAASLETVLARLQQLDPGRATVVEGLAPGDSAASPIVQAARLSAAGVSLAFFDFEAPTKENLAPLIVLANEFQGDLSYDSYSTPTGEGLEAWTFVRGSDLGLRVIVSAPNRSEPAHLWFDDPTLRNPEIFDLGTGGRSALFGLQREPVRLGVRLEDNAPVALLSLERPTAEELQGLDERVDVSGDRIIPVEEILRHLQAFEDAQARRIDHYQALNTNHLRFEGGGSGSVEVTYEGDYFYQRDEGFDWAWQRLFINGVRWKGETLPEIPIIQPEKAAALPLEIHFTKEFRYRLRGSDTINNRETWVIDFDPGTIETGSERKLHQGTVWVDKEFYGRVRTRTVQLGLTGDVLSNEETITQSPLNSLGEVIAWGPRAFWLPIHTKGQQILSVLNTPLVVEREAILTEVRVNGTAFAQAREEVLASDSTMVRDTADGLRYLVKDGDSEGRVVQEEFDTTKLFLLGGIFYDAAADYPLPLAGVNYLALDFRGSGKQVNVFFAGVLLNADISEPSLFGSRFDAGASAFGLAIGLTDETFQGDVEAPEQDVEFQPASVDFSLGRPIGNFFRLGLEYDITSLNYSRADETAEDFTIPTDHLIHSVEVEGRYSRNGYRLTVSGSFNQRDDWQPWGTPEQVENFDPDTEEFIKYRVRVAKNWHLPKFRKFGAEIAWVGGENLDRFTKYEFGGFSSNQIHGYQSSRVRAEEALIAHLNYGLNIGEIFRLEGIFDIASATDESSGLEDELLAGIGVTGGFLGPWETLIQLDAGVAIEGPDDGFTVQLVFLKLFR